MTDDINLPQLPEHFAHQSERVQEHVRGYAREAVRMNRCESRASTHAEGCWSWGPAHYECAMREIERLREEVERLNRLLGRIVEGDGDSTLTIRAGTDAFAAAMEYLSAHKPASYDRKRI